MALRTRIHYPGAVYHALARGVDGREVFADDADRHCFLSTLSRLRRETGFSLLAYCLMGNHFHLAIKVSDIPLGVILQRLLTAYVKTFNSKYERTGHLFQSRYTAILCRDDRYLLGLVRYIHMNPVRANLVATPAQWPWSSHRCYTGHPGMMEVDRPMIYDALNPGTLSPAEAYIDFMQTQETDFQPWPQNDPGTTILSRTEHLDHGTIDELARQHSCASGISIDEIRAGGRRRPVAKIRRQLLGAAIREGHALSSVARWLGCTPGTAHSILYGRGNQNNQKPDMRNG